MDRRDAIDRLPPAYAAALRMIDDGATPIEIAAAAGIVLDAVPVLIAIGEQKLNAILVSELDGGAVVANQPVAVGDREQPDDR